MWSAGAVSYTHLDVYKRQDYAFKEYANRWKFKHPTPADFFRTMEDASGVDLDWFWKGWFYGTEPVDQDLVEVEWLSLIHI